MCNFGTQLIAQIYYNLLLYRLEVLLEIAPVVKFTRNYMQQLNGV